jgi:hypothetical protein
MNIGQDWKCAKDIESFIERNSVMGSSIMLGMGEHSEMHLRHERDFLVAYNNCPPLKSIIGKRAKAFNSGKKDVKRRSTDKTATGSTAKMIRERLTKPNVLQTGRQWHSQLNHYIDIFGYCPVLKVRPAGMPGEISAMWNIPPWLFDIDYTDKLWRQNVVDQIYKSYWILWNGERIEINAKDLFFIFDDGIGTECDTNLTIPDSRMIGLGLPISNVVAAYKARNTLITKRGAIGILSNETKDGDSGSVPISPKDRQEIQNDFKKYGLVGQAYQIIITDAQLKWQQMGFATKDLMLFEEIQDDINRFCEAYGYPVGLMSQQKQSTFNNKTTDRKDFIENTIIPEAESRDEQLVIGMAPDEPDLVIWTDYSALTILQEDKKAAAEARNTTTTACAVEYKSGLITKNEWREAIGMEKRPEPEFEELYDEAAALEAQTNAQIAVNAARNPAPANAE